MSTSLFSPRVRRFGERLSLLIFFSAGLWFLWQGWHFRDGPVTGRAWTSLGLGGLCFVQFGVLLWVQHRRRLRERSGG
jgi:hypothetical protein